MIVSSGLRSLTIGLEKICLTSSTKAAARSLQTSRSTRPACCNYATSVTSTCHTFRNSITLRYSYPNPKQCSVGARHAYRQLSTTSRKCAEATPSASQPLGQQLTWNEFLRLRRTRRYISLFSSIGTAIGGVLLFVPVMAQYEFENQIAALTGLEPFIGIGIAVTAVGAAGWLMGPFVGNAIFGLWKKNLGGEIARRERDFYAHIKRYRADPSSSSVNNPVPDYYGEKIGSVADYRRWLKDQRAFNRKKNKNLI